MDDNQRDQLLERGVNALEQLARDPVIEIEAGPPICPFCNRVDPEIEIQEHGGRGLLSECFIPARTSCCGNQIYALPQIWRIFMNQQDLSEELNMRKGGENGN